MKLDLGFTRRIDTFTVILPNLGNYNVENMGFGLTQTWDGIQLCQ